MFGLNGLFVVLVVVWVVVDVVFRLVVLVLYVSVKFVIR